MRGRTVGHTDCEGNQEPTGGDAQQLPGLGSMLLDPLPDIDPVLLRLLQLKHISCQKVTLIRRAVVKAAKDPF